jgi:glycosyltransferase involved in cell wall biosynthesis
MSASPLNNENLIINQLLNLIPANAKIILEIGCQDSNLKEEYQEINPHCQYLNLRIDPANFDLNNLGITKENIEVIICHNILEILPNFQQFLTRIISYLKAEGVVIASVSNLQYWEVIVKLLQGKWPLENQLLLNNYRGFLTLENVKELFINLNFKIDQLLKIGSINEEFQNFQNLIQPLLKELNIDPNNFAIQSSGNQYVIRAAKTEQPLPRFLIQTLIMAETGCAEIRVYQPDNFSKTIPGVRTFAQVKSLDTNIGLPGEEKVFIIQRMIMNYPRDLTILKRLLDQDYLIVAEIDDDPLRRPEYGENKFLSYRGCHCVQTTTELMKDFLIQHNPNVAVFPNQIAKLPPQRIYEDSKEINLFFGALNREKDWAEIMPILNLILKENEDKIRVKVIHDQVFFEALETKNKEFTPFCSYQKYLEILRSCDLGLLPLSPTRMNTMKSDLKFIEHAANGVTVLASPTVYENTIRQGKTGLIYYSVAEFERMLQELINDTKLRQELAANGYEYVKNNRLLSQHYYKRYHWYREMREKLPLLNQQLKERIPELF